MFRFDLFPPWKKGHAFKIRFSTLSSKMIHADADTMNDWFNTFMVLYPLPRNLVVGCIHAHTSSHIPCYLESGKHRTANVLVLQQ